jgi:hypothetical protein
VRPIVVGGNRAVRPEAAIVGSASTFTQDARNRGTAAAPTRPSAVRHRRFSLCLLPARIETAQSTTVQTLKMRHRGVRGHRTARGGHRRQAAYQPTSVETLLLDVSGLSAAHRRLAADFVSADLMATRNAYLRQQTSPAGGALFNFGVDDPSALLTNNGWPVTSRVHSSSAAKRARAT